MTAGVLCASSNFWTLRPSDSWTAAEIKEMVTGSPWARAATVRVPEGTAAPEIVVRWDSAAPVREACSVGGMVPHLFTCASKLLYVSGLGQKFEALRQEYYVIGVSNYPKPARASGDPPEHSDAGDAMLAQMGRRIQHSTFLKREGKAAVAPDQIVVLPAGDSLLLIVFFPRTAKLVPEDGEVRFECTDSTLTVTAPFDLREMKYRERLEL